MDVGTAIKEIRIKSLLSQTGLSFSTVNRWENGKAVPGFKAIKRIKDFCLANKIEFNIDSYIKKQIESE